MKVLHREERLPETSLGEVTTGTVFEFPNPDRKPGAADLYIKGDDCDRHDRVLILGADGVAHYEYPNAGIRPRPDYVLAHESRLREDA